MTNAESIRPRVLVVEDDRASAEALVRILRRLGFDATPAATVHDALKRLPGHQMVILDLMLPDGEGTDLLERIRAQARSVRVAVTTSSGMDSAVVERARRLGPDAIFQKPLQLNELLAWLQKDREANHDK